MDMAAMVADVVLEIVLVVGGIRVLLFAVPRTGRWQTGAALLGRRQDRHSRRTYVGPAAVASARYPLSTGWMLPPGRQRSGMPMQRLVNEGRMAFALYATRGWLVSTAGAGALLVLIGVPTDLIETSLFTRMIAAQPRDYVLWVLTALLGGLLLGSFAARVGTGVTGEGKALSSGLLSYLAVGCPICNKAVVLLLGVSGALTWFAPLQLYIGLASLALMAWALRLRLRALAGSCAVPPPPREISKPAIPLSPR